jgi:hypothetical protein
MASEDLSSDNCEVDRHLVTVNIDNCNEGPIVRDLDGNDASGNGPVTCTQTIFVFHVSDWVVEFPADVTAQCVDGLCLTWVSQKYSSMSAN